MSDLKDPPRLLEASGGAEPGLRDLLATAKNDVGSDAQVARLAERLGPLLAPPALPVPPVAANAARMGAAAKLGLAGIALILAGGGVLLSTSKLAPPSATISPHASPPVPPESPAAAASPSPVVEAPGVQPPQAAASNGEPPGAANLPAKPAPPAQLSEAELLEQARSALKSDPARALARANEHRKRFPGGVLVQEREVIAIKALRELGRTAEADSRTAAFEKAFPGSAFQRKLKPSP
ncbi:MAG TPA: hypothetical protein VNG33_06955 [Polyangiaceae bacterium]|nr:hypothetical protein [Polyangiaceae bacterium]